VVARELAFLENDQVALAEHRERELAKSLEALGLNDHRYLGESAARWPGREPRRYEDSATVRDEYGVEQSPDVHSGSLVMADLGEVAADIAAVIADVEPTVVISYDPIGGDGHPDHIRVHEAAKRAAEVMGVAFYAIAPRAVGTPASVSVDVSSVLERKRKAIRAHESSVIVRGNEFAVESGRFEPIESVETFVRIRGEREGSSDFASQSVGGKIGTSVLALAVGVVTGAVLTVTHQATARFGEVSVPWGIIAAVALCAALLAGLRLVFASRLVPGLAALGVLGSVALLSLPGVGGSILVPANPAGYVWTFAPTVIALVVLLWPGARTRR
jgi:N-acetyl-1-D-myo-inositol-2-amino-2-deoxy-alpha-D-glucopyranoside deacetylase